MLRGEIWLADLEPVRGSEANKVRPVVLVTNDGANLQARASGRGTVTVLPMTTSVLRVFPMQVALEAAESGLDYESKVQAEQIRALDVSRLVRRVGRVDEVRMMQVDAAMRLHLAL